MEEILSVAVDNLTSPMVMFFALGFLAAMTRVDLSLPQPVAKTIAVYLMLAIGFKGGVGMAGTGTSLTVLAPIAIGILISALLPFIGYQLLRMTSGLSSINAAAVAAHFGSISIVTFLTASQILIDRGTKGEGILVAVAAAMEAPAIVAGIWIAARHLKKNPSEQTADSGELSMREAALNSSILVLIGSFIIGWVVGPQGLSEVKPFISDPFKGVLCLFLLDMGAIAGRGLMQNRKLLDFGVVTFGLYMPLIGAVVMALSIWPLDLSVAGKTLMLVLAASASYIAVPAAMRLALPQANPAVYVTLSLGVTFPFNLVIGIPLYVALANWLY
ncbi:sodium-dependent bicarbonate transport family permease [Terasakiella sp. A23]|uniref:sodium-dependent bicarbonate transport family permease n=1 Tax=Terasakiella sp. FCG-A23 TaxID=3080561 RepID=UPI0029548F70|nr:sodium-dependent bicarbonate transport family permease [Terasakiella sp. A23]MDV7337958.1 sodium-dependent bicarbonate transport family permease [Terasakiella sp. A23]